MKSVKPVVLSLLLVFSFTAWGGADDVRKASAPVGSAGGESAPLVTFVELGSVRCIPCKMMQPVMKEIEETYRGQVQVVFHDVWTEAGKPFGEQFKIRVIPTQVFLDREGREYFRHEGFFPKDELVKILKQKGVK